MVFCCWLRCVWPDGEAPCRCKVGNPGKSASVVSMLKYRFCPLWWCGQGSNIEFSSYKLNGWRKTCAEKQCGCQGQVQARTSKHPCQPSTFSTASPWWKPVGFLVSSGSGGSFRFLNLIKPVMCVLPEVEAPDRFSDGTCVVDCCCGKNCRILRISGFRKNSDEIKIASNWISKIWWYQYIYFHHLFCSGSRKGLRISDIFFKAEIGVTSSTSWQLPWDFHWFVGGFRWNEKGDGFVSGRIPFKEKVLHLWQQIKQYTAAKARHEHDIFFQDKIQHTIYTVGESVSKLYTYWFMINGCKIHYSKHTICDLESSKPFQSQPFQWWGIATTSASTDFNLFHFFDWNGTSSLISLLLVARMWQKWMFDGCVPQAQKGGSQSMSNKSFGFNKSTYNILVYWLCIINDIYAIYTYIYI